MTPGIAARKPGGGRRRPLPRIDEEATQQRLQELLLSKSPGEDAIADIVEIAGSAGGEALVSSPLGGLGGLGRGPLGPMALLKAQRAAATPDGGSVSESSVAGTALASAGVGAPSTACGSTALAMAALREKQERELEEERARFVQGICSPSTRNEVKKWVGNIYTMKHEAKLQAEQEGAQGSRRRRLRSRSCGANSDAGLSGFSAVSGITGDSATGTTATNTATNTGLAAVGGSIAAGRSASIGGLAGMSGHRPKSASSAGSLVVHNEVDEPLTVKERVQGYLAGRLPDLDTHVSRHIAQKTEALQKEVDEDIADIFLRDTAQRGVFRSHANRLRWQNSRHQVLQKRLCVGVPRWTMEAIESWDAKKAMSREPEVSNEDLIYDYLTKRGSHIDTNSLPSEIPIFRTMHASYSLPSMWRERYI